MTTASELVAAKIDAQRAGLFVVVKAARAHTEYRLYREQLPRNVFIGRRTTVPALRALIQQSAGSSRS